MEQNKEELPARILEALKAELLAAGKDSSRLVNALDEFEKSIGEELIPGLKKRIFLPLEIEESILKTELENQKREICLRGLKSVADTLNRMLIEIENAQFKYYREMREREQ